MFPERDGATLAPPGLRLASDQPTARYVDEARRAQGGAWQAHIADDDRLRAELTTDLLAAGALSASRGRALQACVLLFGATRLRGVDGTMAPDSVLAIRRAALGAPRRPPAGGA